VVLILGINVYKQAIVYSWYKMQGQQDTIERRMLVFRLILRVVEGMERETNPFEEVRHSPLSIMLIAAKKVVSDHFAVARSDEFPYGAIYTPGQNGTSHEVFIYFPSIVINEDPIFVKLLKELVWKLNESKPIKTSIFGEIIWDLNNVTFDEKPQACAFSPDYSCNCEEVTFNDIRQCAQHGITQNNLILVIDRFDLLMRHFRRVVDKETNNKGPNFFQKNIRYIASAFYRSPKNTVYHERGEDGIDVGEWIKTANSFGVEDAVAVRYMNEAREYAYTVITLEDILKRESRESREMISNYNEDRFRYMVKALIKDEHRSAADIWKCFAEFVRKDHFYAEGDIYVMDDNFNRKCEPHELRPVVDKFIKYVREGQISIAAECLEIGETMDVAKVMKSIKDITSPFTGDAADRRILAACKNYLHTSIKTRIRQTCIPFRDVVAVYDANEVTTTQDGKQVQGTLRFRKAFMEDQFTSASEIPLMGFGSIPEEIKAIDEVKETLFKMFANWENVKWFIRWLGSLFTHRPERVCLVLYGPKGGNAKSTLANILVRIFGAAADSFMPTIMQGGKCCLLIVND
jgi:hypothetical protein